jgi:hypothetical protein
MPLHAFAELEPLDDSALLPDERFAVVRLPPRIVWRRDSPPLRIVRLRLEGERGEE